MLRQIMYNFIIIKNGGEEMRRIIIVAILLIMLSGCDVSSGELKDFIDNVETIIPDINKPGDDIIDDEIEINPDKEQKPNPELDKNEPEIESKPESDSKPEEIVPEVKPDYSYLEFKDVVSWLDKQETDYKTYSFLVGGTYTYNGTSYISTYLFDDLTYSTDLIKVNTKARPGTKREIKWIVIHDTGNLSKTADALNHSKYIKNLANENKTSISWHYTVDMKNIINHVPDNEVAWHAGDGLRDVGSGNYLGGGNKNGIGIEMCVNRTNDILLTYKKTAKLAAHLMVKYNLDINDVKKHYDFSGKNCPSTMIYNKTWDEFLMYVESEYTYLKKYSNFKFDIIDGVNVNDQGLILGNNYDYKIKITNTLTNNTFIYEK